MGKHAVVTTVVSAGPSAMMIIILLLLLLLIGVGENSRRKTDGGGRTRAGRVHRRHPFARTVNGNNKSPDFHANAIFFYDSPTIIF